MIPAGTKVYFAVAPTDLRKSFDGLSALASGQLQKDPSEGGLFVFLNKRGDQVRVLFRDRHGCCVLAKRLNRGRFRRPRVKDGSFCWEIDASALMMFLDDIDVSRQKANRSPASIVQHLKIVKAQPPHS
jgi:transposase